MPKSVDWGSGKLVLNFCSCFCWFEKTGETREQWPLFYTHPPTRACPTLSLSVDDLLDFILH